MRVSWYDLYIHIGHGTFLRNRNVSEMSTDRRTILISDRNTVPIKILGISDGIGIFSEFRSESATKDQNIQYDLWNHKYNDFEITISKHDPVEKLLLTTFKEEIRHINNVIRQHTISGSLNDITNLLIEPVVPVIIRLYMTN